jgi:CRISPR-associated protein Csm4
MPDEITYRLSFRAPLHVGARGVGLEESRAHVPADTLFSALCTMWREFYDVKALKDLLDVFTADAATPKPFHLTSAFPYAGSVRFFPRPRVPQALAHAGADAKKLRAVRFVSERIFTQLAHGGAPALLTVQRDSIWIDQDDVAALQPWRTDDDDYLFWRRRVVPRVTLDRITSASALWHFGSVVFAKGRNGKDAGLWFAAQVQDDYRPRFEAALRLLGDSGLGGERGAGHGLFTCANPTADSLPDVADADHFITLAPCCPQKPEVAQLIAGRYTAYELLTRRGWAGSPEAGNLRRKQVWMFGEGSVLCGAADTRAGRLVEVTPVDNEGNNVSPHPVWRYGFAYPVGAKLS